MGKRSQKRLGQGAGSGRGKTAGRGTKGTNARTKVPQRFEGGALVLIKRLPFLRGKDRNKSLQIKPMVINLMQLSHLPAKTNITVEELIKRNIVSEDAKIYGVKLLGDGKVTNAYTVAIPASKSAIEKITKAGGSVTAA
jgi:large subunit ribosomal protein L15